MAVASSALGIFMLCGGGRQGLQAGILFYACVTLATGIVTFFGLDNTDASETWLTVSTNSEVLSGIKRVLGHREPWMAGFIIFFSYAAYAGLTYFNPVHERAPAAES